VKRKPCSGCGNPIHEENYISIEVYFGEDSATLLFHGWECVKKWMEGRKLLKEKENGK